MKNLDAVNSNTENVKVVGIKNKSAKYGAHWALHSDSVPSRKLQARHSAPYRRDPEYPTTFKGAIDN